MSFKSFQSYLEYGISLHHPKKENYMNMRDKIGGKCVRLSGIHKDIACLEAISLYHAAMAFHDFFALPFSVEDEGIVIEDIQKVC